MDDQEPSDREDHVPNLMNYIREAPLRDIKSQAVNIIRK